MDYFLLIAVLLGIIPLVRWSARIERRTAEQEDKRAMQRCKEADERAFRQSVARVKQQSIYVSTPELETQEAVVVEDETTKPPQSKLELEVEIQFAEVEGAVA